MDEIRSKFAELFREINTCPFKRQCRIDDVHLGRLDPRLARTRDPQPGFLGLNYAQRRIVLIGKNPGVDGSGNYLAKDKRMYGLFDQFAKNGEIRVFEEAMNFLDETMNSWKPIRDLRPSECGFNFPDDVAYLNLAKCPTWEKDIKGRFKDIPPEFEIVSRCVKENLTRQLEVLQPKVVVFLGKSTQELFPPGLLSKDVNVPGCINRAQAETSAKTSENNLVRAKIRQAVASTRH